MSDPSDALSASLTVVSRLFMGDTISRVFVGNAVTLEQPVRRVADLANDTIPTRTGSA
jgi:hypothetical protein